jgi:hypothetical protein
MCYWAGPMEPPRKRLEPSFEPKPSKTIDGEVVKSEVAPLRPSGPVEDESPYRYELGWLKWHKLPQGPAEWIAWAISGVILTAVLVVVLPALVPFIEKWITGPFDRLFFPPHR